MDKINVTYPSFCVPSPPTFSLLSYFPTFFSFLICMPDYELALLLKDCNFVVMIYFVVDLLAILLHIFRGF